MCGATRKNKGKGKEYKISFWNMAGLENKDKELWEKLKKWDVMFLSKTWLQRKGWEKVRKWLPKGYVWEVQETGRKKKGERWGERLWE